MRAPPPYGGPIQRGLDQVLTFCERMPVKGTGAGSISRRRTEQGQLLLDRELSWLDFDRRVLAMAEDAGVPFSDRVRLCGIVSGNLDEFFAVRVAGLYGRRGTGRTLAEIRARVLALKDAQSALWLDGLQPDLAEAGTRVLRARDCKRRELRSLTKRFNREVKPLLTPIA